MTENSKKTLKKIAKSMSTARKAIVALTTAQKAITVAVFVFALVCTFATVSLAREFLTGRLDHAYNPNFCGSVTITELPERLTSEPNPVLASFDFGQGAPYSHRLSFTYDDLNNWLGQPQPGPNEPMNVVVDLSKQCLIGVNLFSQRTELVPMGTGDFYVTISRPVVVEMCRLLKGTNDTYTFRIDLNPIQLSSSELTLRGVLYLARQQFDFSVGQSVLILCAGMSILALVAVYFWRKNLYVPSRGDILLFEYDENNCFGRWDD